MKILYNPAVPNGAPIGKGYNNFVVNGVVIDSLLPGEVKQYDDNVAQTILDEFGFIEEITLERAKKLLEKPREKDLKCDKCDFSTDTKIALISHSKKHEKEALNQEELADIPAAKNSKLAEAPNGDILAKSVPGIVTSESEDIENGIDKDGVEWYGEGRKEHREAMNAVTPFNKGRFGGQPLAE